MGKVCLGGSFNPIHYGHLICARAAAESAGFEGVVLVPGHQPPHKPASGAVAAPEHRLAMCRLAIEGLSGFEVDDLEIARGGVSYTLDTVRQLKTGGCQNVSWLIGTDMLQILPKWHEPLALMREARLVVMGRAGWDFAWDALPAPFRALRANVVNVPAIEISATQIRQRVAAGRSIDLLTPPGVVRYIEGRGLYRQNDVH